MLDKEFDATGGMAILGELARLTAEPAGPEEICDQGLALVVKALGPQRALLALRRAGDGSLQAAAARGPDAERDLIGLGAKSMSDLAPVEETGSSDGKPLRVALPLTGAAGAVGAIVLDCPRHWNPAARIFARSAARAIASALGSSRVIRETREQGEQLAKRNVELEALREFAVRVQTPLAADHEILEEALDLVLQKLGLDAGWIFWGEKGKGEMELAAARGVAEEFICRAREEGIGPCLCQDVFKTGRLQYARNTLECPRLPELVRGNDPMTHACIPLKFERDVLGVMNIANRPGQIFTPEELHFMETLGRQVCLAVDKARSIRSESRRDAEARALASLTRAIGGSLDQHRVLAAVGDYGRELLEADRCLILLGDDPERLRFAYLSGAKMDVLEEGGEVDLKALGSRAFLAALSQRQVMVIEDALDDARANPELARRLDLRSVVIVPLMAHERLEGILVAARSRPSSWRPDEVELAHALAGHAALAIENARLYREAQEAFLRLQHAQYNMMRAERMAAVGTLAASLAHEVRNPLNSINLQLVLLSRRVARAEPSLQTEVEKLLESARKEIARLDTLVNEFLSLSTIDNLSLAAASPGEVLREIIDLMAPVARERGIDVTDEIEASLPPIRMDREKMKQVLINLVRNALEAMPESGTLALFARNENGAVVFGVGDTGVGIEPGIDIFNFFTTTKRGGTGLGLPIARRIVEAHGGTLAYTSEPGRGTVFSVILPAQARDGGGSKEKVKR